MVVRAYDKAGNYREGTVKIQIFAEGISITKKGIQYRANFIPWWRVIFVFLMIITLGSFYYWKRLQNSIRKRKNKLNGMKKKLEDYRGIIKDEIEKVIK